MEAAFLYRQMMMARLAGVKENALLDLLLSRVKGVSSERSKITMGPNKSFFLPYFMREQENVINANAFEIESGGLNPDAGSTVDGITYHNGSREIIVRATNSQFTSTIQRLERYFLKGESVIVLNIGSGNVAQVPVMQIEAAFNADAGGVPKARIRIKPPYTNADWGPLPDKTPYQPVEGVVQIGANSISDYESWCNNQPADLSRKVKTYWPQTSRFTRCWDDEYEKFLDQIFKGDVNPYLERFKELPMSEQNRQQYAQFQKKWLNTIFYGTPIDIENQTAEKYMNLPHVTDPRTGQFIEYKSSAKGLRYQLGECSRITDYQGGDLDFNVLEQQLFSLKRTREVDGGTIEEIDCITDRSTANRIKTMMTRYYQLKYGTSWERHMGPPSNIMFEDKMLWFKQSYDFDEAHVRLNVMVENAMTDDRFHFTQSANPNLATRGNKIWLLDWADLEVGVSNVAKVRRDTPDPTTDPDFRCTIAANISHYDLESVSYTPMLGDENRHLIIENFSNNCPQYQVDICEPTVGP
jgi:hypothetical protein